MFVWWSNGSGGSKIGCCGGLLFLPLGLMLFTGDMGGGSWLIWLAVAVAVALFVLPQFTRSAEGGYEKRKNETYGDYDAYGEKPKREGDRYILTDDGEIMEADDDTSLYNSGQDRR